MKTEEGLEARYRKPHGGSDSGVIHDLSEAGISFSIERPRARQNDLAELYGLETGLKGVPDESLESKFRTVNLKSGEPDPSYFSPSILPEVLKQLALNTGNHKGISRLAGDVIPFKLGGRRWTVRVSKRMLAAMHTYLNEAFREQYFTETRWGLRRAMSAPKGESSDFSELGRAEYCDWSEEGSRLLQEVPDPIGEGPVFLPDFNLDHKVWTDLRNKKKFQSCLDWIDKQTDQKKLIALSHKARAIHFGDYSEKRVVHGKTVLVKLSIMREKRFTKDKQEIVFREQVGIPGLSFAQYWQLQFAITEKIVENMILNHKKFMVKLEAQIRQAERAGLKPLQECLQERLGAVSSDFLKRVEARWLYWENDAKRALLADVGEALTMPSEEEFAGWVEQEWAKAKEWALLNDQPIPEVE